MTRTRILIVDDNADTTTVARLVLGKDGYDVLSVTSGEAAVRLLASTRVDLVLLDLRLPGMDGIETCHRIKSMSDPPVVLLFTVSDFHADRARAVAAGADGYVVKPVPAPDLLAAIARSLVIEDRPCLAVQA